MAVFKVAPSNSGFGSAFYRSSAQMSAASSHPPKTCSPDSDLSLLLNSHANLAPGSSTSSFLVLILILVPSGPFILIPSSTSIHPPQVLLLPPFVAILPLHLPRRHGNSENGQKMGERPQSYWHHWIANKTLLDIWGVKAPEGKDEILLWANTLFAIRISIFFFKYTIWAKFLLIPNFSWKELILITWFDHLIPIAWFFGQLPSNSPVLIIHPNMAAPIREFHDHFCECFPRIFPGGTMMVTGGGREESPRGNRKPDERV